MGVSLHTFRRKKRKKMEAYSLLRLRARPVCASSSSILIHGKFCWACVRMTLITKMMRSWRKKNLLESLLRLIREKKMWTTSFTFKFPWIKQSNFFTIYKDEDFFPSSFLCHMIWELRIGSVFFLPICRYKIYLHVGR